ncbi:hypothetical protein JCM10213_008995 [Rhodosporidiobolus nylandii]
MGKQPTWRDTFDLTVNAIRESFLGRANLHTQTKFRNAGVRGFGTWANAAKEAAEELNKVATRRFRGKNAEEKERYRGLQAEAKKEVDEVLRQVEKGEIKTVDDLPPVTGSERFPVLSQYAEQPTQAEAAYRTRNEAAPHGRQRRSASPRSLAVFHHRVSLRQAQLYGTTQRAFAEGRAF